MPGRFAARCQRGHELIEFTDPTEFERHMTGTHKAKRLRVGGSHPTFTAGRKAPGYSETGRFTPYPWAAPATPKNWRANLAKILDENRHDVLDAETDWIVPPAVLAAGDVFTLGAVPYEVLEAADDGQLHIAEAGKPERHRWFSVGQIAAKRDRVRLISRAA